MSECGCSDPGMVTSGQHLSVLDGQFCEFRLQNAPGLLTARVTGSGGFQINFSTSPVTSLDSFQTTVNQNFGNFVAILANGTMNQLLGPATANLVPMTDASGGVAFRALPAATVPDPLTLTTINVTNLTAGALTLTGTMSAAGLPSGTVVNQLGLDGSGNVVKASNSTSVAIAMFFESPTSASTATPNAGVIAGGFLTIGNLLFDSGGNIASVTDAQTIKVLVAGTAYRIDWCGQIDVLAAKRTGMTIQLVINGIIVNNANGFPLDPLLPSSNPNTALTITGMHAQALAVNDTIKLQLASASGTDIDTFQVRLVLTKIS